MATHNPSEDDPRTRAAKVKARVRCAELAIEDVVNSAPPPTPEAIRRLRLLLPEVG